MLPRKEFAPQLRMDLYRLIYILPLEPHSNIPLLQHNRQNNLLLEQKKVRTGPTQKLL